MVSLWHLLPLFLPSAVYAQADCDSVWLTAISLNYFFFEAPTDAMRTVCHQLNNWDDSARVSCVSLIANYFGSSINLVATFRSASSVGSRSSRHCWYSFFSISLIFLWPLGQASVMMVLPAATITDPAACNDIPCICGIVGGRFITFWYVSSL